MPWIIPVVVSTVGSLVSAKIGSSAAKKAATTQAEAAEYAADLQYKASQEALALQKEQFEKGQANLAPYMQVGGEGLGYLSQMMQPGSTFFQGDPGYQFRLAEGQKALERSASARGSLLSGGTLKATERYAQGIASDEYNRAFQRYMDVAGMGQASAAGMANLSRSYAGEAGNIMLATGQNIGDLATQAANARASGYVGSGNIWSNTISGLGSNIGQMILLSQIMKQQSPPYVPAPSVPGVGDLIPSPGVSLPGTWP